MTGISEKFHADLTTAIGQALTSEHWSGSPALLTVGGGTTDDNYVQAVGVVCQMFTRRVMDAILPLIDQKLDQVYDAGRRDTAEELLQLAQRVRTKVEKRS